jgi:hypothetical protein
MKKLMLPLAAVGLLTLTGCVGYVGAPYGYYDNGPYYGYGSPYYGYGAGVVVEQRPSYFYGGSTYYRDRGTRDRDRDGDGVPNRRDAYPNDPRRR